MTTGMNKNHKIELIQNDSTNGHPIIIATSKTNPSNPSSDAKYYIDRVEKTATEYNVVILFGTIERLYLILKPLEHIIYHVMPVV